MPYNNKDRVAGHRETVTKKKRKRYQEINSIKPRCDEESQMVLIALCPASASHLIIFSLFYVSRVISTQSIGSSALFLIYCVINMKFNPRAEIPVERYSDAIILIWFNKVFVSFFFLIPEIATCQSQGTASILIKDCRYVLQVEGDLSRWALQEPVATQSIILFTALILWCLYFFVVVAVPACFEHNKHV